MSKTVLASHIIGERGVNAFENYCNRHQPYIIWRETIKNDFGIDGEVELTEVTSDGKTRPISQTLKVQIKSTQSDKSYMQDETDDSFSFYPKDSDLEYWRNYRQYGYEVLLVVFDGRGGQEKLYCKLVSAVNEVQLQKKGKRKTSPIVFSKTDNLLVAGQNGFDVKYRASFAGRVDFAVTETLDTNMWPFRSVPRQLFTYPTHYKNRGDIFKKLSYDDAPFFVIKNSLIYTFVPLEKTFQKFFVQVVSEGQKRSDYAFRDVVDSAVLRTYYVELLNEYIRDFMGKRGLKYQRDFRRYYFNLREPEVERTATYTSRVHRKKSEKTVVKYYEYAADKFYRHDAVSLQPLFVDNRVYLVVSPKYLFTLDRTTPLPGDKITRYTNYLNMRVWNNGVLSQLHFWHDFLARSGGEITVFDGGPVNQDSITLGNAVNFDVGFGIPLEGQKRSLRQKGRPAGTPRPQFTQPGLFD